MQIRSIGHACVAVEVSGTRILCDPWWNGPAYTSQWWHYPLPRVEAVDRERVDYIYLSHGHEDHLHVPTLRTITRDATLVIPRFRETGMRDFLATLGFKRILEIGHGETRTLDGGVKATIYLNKDDSILVLEAGGRTLVNANDALHASSRHVVDHYCDQIRRRHPNIDTLLLGYGGAAWFPNCLQVTDDVGYDGAARERIFAENFAYVARRMGAKMALPFAASFALLEDSLRWINDVKWRTDSPCAELERQVGGAIRSHFLMPGDRIVGEHWMPGGLGRPTAEQAEADLQREFGLQMSELRQRHSADEMRIQKIYDALHANVMDRAARVLKHRQRILCRIDVRDVPDASFLLDATASRARLARCDRLRLAPMVLTTRLAILEALATQEYGAESISIGYGATLQLRRRDLSLRNALLAILGRRPLRPSRMERLLGWARAPRRSFDCWRRDLHWTRLALDLRRGKVRRTNDLYSHDPERWSPLRREPLPAPRRARAS